MKKISLWILATIALLVLIVLLFVDDETPITEDETTKSIEQKSEVKATERKRSAEGDYTIFVYMNGSDLESTYDEESDSYYGAATDDLDEMIAGVYGDDVRIVIETGGTLAWANELIDSQQNQRWLIENGTITHLEDLGQRNIGEADTLTDFLVWGIEQYPADKYALLFWNHGGGAVLGFGVDEWFDYDSLTLDEIDLALAAAYERTETTFELIGFDACLMATVETASMLSKYGHYLVASEELEPGHGWDYEAALSQLSENPNVDGAQLGAWIADTYREHAVSYGQDRNITLSVIDLDKMNDVVTALEAFVQDADNVIAADPSRFYAFAQGRSRAEEYGTGSSADEATDMIDLRTLISNVDDDYPESASTLIQAIEQAVVHNVNSVGRPAASGLSIYFPHRNKANFSSNLESYANIGFSPIYTTFVGNYADGLMSESEQLDWVASGDLQFAYTGEEDEYAPYEVSVNPDDLERIEQIYAVVMMEIEDDSLDESTLLYLGYDHDVDADWEEGIVRDNFTGEWLMWDGNFVTLELVTQGDGYVRYSIPAKVNGKEMDILVHYDMEESSFEVLGAWSGVSENSGMPDKNLLQIKAGDHIVPQFYYYYDDDNDGYIDGDEFVVGDTIDFEYEFLPNGSYYYAFAFVDYAGNETMTEFIAFELED